MDLPISQILFYLFALAALVSAFGVVAFRNPVSSAMCMAACFGFVAAIFFGLGAEFLGIVQIMVYAGAVLVLFLFVVMMLDVKKEEKLVVSLPAALVGTCIAAVFAGMITNVSLSLPGATDCCPMVAACETPANVQSNTTPNPSKFGGPLAAPKSGERSDTHILGEMIFTKYNIPFAILSFALLSACVGTVAISRKLRQD